MWHSNCPFYISVILGVLAFAGEGIKETDNAPAKVPALFTFGDSIVDPGNNNFIPTILKANTPPYGQDFVGNKPTGRFSNGKLSPDFIAADLGIKETLPPFLDPALKAQDLLTGVSFASAGSGFDNLTAETINVIPIWKQVELFKHYKALLVDLAGMESTSNIIGESIFLSVAGTNDFSDNYFLLPTRKKQFSIAQYQDFLLQICTTFIEDLYTLGARKFGVYGLPPMGCVPLQKTLYGQSKVEGCIEELNQVAVSYNTKLMLILHNLKARLPGSKVVYVDIYYNFLDIVKNPSKYGFETSSRGCCGTGLTEIGPTCNFITPGTKHLEKSFTVFLTKISRENKLVLTLAKKPRLCQGSPAYATTYVYCSTDAPCYRQSDSLDDSSSLFCYFLCFYCLFDYVLTLKLTRHKGDVVHLICIRVFGTFGLSCLQLAQLHDYAANTMPTLQHMHCYLSTGHSRQIHQQHS